MRYLQLLILGILSMCANANAENSNTESHQEIVEITNIDTQLNICRKSIQDTTSNNTNVLNQFDIFANTLKNTYVSGEGLIDKDIIKIINAIKFAAYKHRFQVRKDPYQTPYIIHPIGVANTLMTLGNVRDPDIIIGALLHDTVEDTETTFEEIEQRFGVRVANFVREVTDDKSLPKQTRKQLQIEHAPKKSAGAAQIKLADKLYNLKDLAQAPPSDWKKERVDAYFQWAKAVVNNLPWVNAPLKQAVDDVIQSYWKNNIQL